MGNKICKTNYCDDLYLFFCAERYNRRGVDLPESVIIALGRDKDPNIKVCEPVQYF